MCLASDAAESTDNRVAADDRNLCSSGHDDWPAQQVYGRSLLGRAKDSSPAAEVMLTEPQQRWMINRGGPGNDDTPSE